MEVVNIAFVILDSCQEEKSDGCVSLWFADYTEETDRFYINSDICIDFDAVQMCFKMNLQKNFVMGGKKYK